MNTVGKLYSVGLAEDILHEPKWRSQRHQPSPCHYNNHECFKFPRAHKIKQQLRKKKKKKKKKKEERRKKRGDEEKRWGTPEEKQWKICNGMQTPLVITCTTGKKEKRKGKKGKKRKKKNLINVIHQLSSESLTTLSSLTLIGECCGVWNSSLVLKFNCETIKFLWFVCRSTWGKIHPQPSVAIPNVVQFPPGEMLVWLRVLCQPGLCIFFSFNLLCNVAYRVFSIVCHFH